MKFFNMYSFSSPVIFAVFVNYEYIWFRAALLRDVHHKIPFENYFLSLSFPPCLSLFSFRCWISCRLAPGAPSRDTIGSLLGFCFFLILSISLFFVLRVSCRSGKFMTEGEDDRGRMGGKDGREEEERRETERRKEEGGKKQKEEGCIISGCLYVECISKLY